MAFYCKDCDKEHEGLPDLGMDHPDPYLEVPEDEREERTTYSLDRCTVTDEDGETHYFIRGVIFIPIKGQENPFGIGVWVSQSEKNFDRYLEDDEDMVDEPTFGWLVNRVGFYEKDTFLLKTRVHFSGGRRRPTIELEPTDHPFAVDQREGITLEKAWKIVHRYMD
jgi:hypothetical protein